MNSETAIQLLRHYLVAVWYRTQKALTDAPDGFADFSAGSGVRTPTEVVAHMADLVAFIVAQFTDAEWDSRPPIGLAQEAHRLRENLRRLDGLLQDSGALTVRTVEQILQGPFADAMTHVGQLALLRRLAGAPIPPEDFTRPHLEAGKFPQ